MYRLMCPNCKDWKSYLDFLPTTLKHTIADTRIIKILPYYGDKWTQIPPFKYCGWCGSKLEQQFIGVNKLDRFKYKFLNWFLKL